MDYTKMSENVSSADDQQERLVLEIEPWFISGFVDGEGTFHVAFAKRQDLPRKWAVIPEFHISQHRDRANVLYEIQQYFNCGSIRENHVGRVNDVTLVYVVRNRHDLVQTIIPFFRQYPLRSSKRLDFERFAQIVQAMENGEHFTDIGFKSIVEKAFQMNNNGHYRKRKREEIIIQESSTTIRQDLP
jgi:hypothetical protein